MEISGRARGLATSQGARITLIMSFWFCAWGMTTPFLPRWLEADRHLTGTEIGAVLAAAQLLRIVTGPALGSWADGFKDRRTPIRLLTGASLVLYALYLTLAQGFIGLFLISFAAASVAQAVGPLIEGAALRAAQGGPIPFGISRGIGSILYIVGNIGGGALVAAIGLIAVPIWTIACLVIVNIAAWRLLLPEPAPPRAPSGFRSRLRTGLGVALQPKWRSLLFGCGLIIAAHAFYYAFSTIIWRGQGISATTIGYLWAIGVGFEVMLLFALPRIERVLAPETFILIGAGAGVLRWTGLAFAPTGFLLWPLQILHGLTFSTVHVGLLRIVQRDAPDEHSVFLQTIHAALHAGILIGLGSLLSGFLYDHARALGYLAMTAMCLAGAALIWPLWEKRNG